jgi:DNA-binding beta-propeller fold protein YncE
VFDADNTSARATLIAREQKDGAPVVVERGQIAVLNPTAVAPNRPPQFVGSPQLQPTAWRGRQELRLQVSNEADDAIVYTWRATGGRLEHERTLLPVNSWTAPPQAGAYRITVEATDGGRNVARTAFQVQSTGLGEARIGALRATPRALGGPSRYALVRDVAFDRLKNAISRRFVLDVPTGWGAEPAVIVEQPERSNDWVVRLPVTDHDFAAMVASNPTAGAPGALYCLDRGTKTVLRFPFGGEWNQVLKRAPLVIGEPDGGTGNARFQDPIDLALAPDGEVYVLDAGQRAVQAFSPEGSFLVSFGRPGTRPLELQQPRALAVGPDGAVYVLDDGRKTVVVFRGWRAVSEFPVGAPEEELVGVAVDPFASTVYVLERSMGAVRRYSPDGRLLGRFAGEPGSAGALQKPVRVRCEPTRVVWVIDRDGLAVARFDPEGAFLGRMQTTELPATARVAGRPNGGVALLDRSDRKVLCFDQNGWLTARFGVPGSKPGEFGDPVDISVSATGDVFVLDAEKQLIAKFSPQGAFLEQVGRPGEGPSDLTGVMDLAAVNDRSYLLVTQQRSSSNFNLFDPATGRSERAWGELTGDMTPRFGCVTGVNGRLDGRREAGARFSDRPFFWFTDDDRERVFRAPFSGAPEQVALEVDEVSDIEALPTGHVIVIDGGEGKLLVLNPQDGSVAQTLLTSERLTKAYDVGLDDYGRVYVFDGSRRRVVELADSD